MKDENDNFFTLLLNLKNSINQQIPLAANRYEVFECPARDEDEHDLDIQFYLHESFSKLIHFHYLANTKLITMVKYEELDTAADNTQKINDLVKLRGLLVFQELERLWKLSATFDDISFKAAKPKLYKIFEEKIASLYSGGKPTLIVDEKKIIEVFLQELEEKITLITEKLLNQEILTPEELSTVDRFRRENTPHEEQINQFFTNLCFNNHFPEKKITISEHEIQLFKEDALHNIHSLGKKLHSQKHSYEQRFKANRELLRHREKFDSDMIMGCLDDFIKSMSSLQCLSLHTQIKYQTLRIGLFYEQQKIDSGYCSEHTALAVVKLLLMNTLDNHRLEMIDIFYADGDGHAFLGIDRLPSSILNDFSTWGDEAIVFDAWNQFVCYAKDLEKQAYQYHSFPNGARWSSTELTHEDVTFLKQLYTLDECYHEADKSHPANKEKRIIEEYGLEVYESDDMLLSHINQIVDKYLPSNIEYKITFYRISMGGDLVKYIPGFCQPVIAIHEGIVPLLASRKLNLTALEFAIVTLLLHLKMQSSFITPISLSLTSIQDIDIQAMKLVKSTPACIKYLRVAAQFEEKNKLNKLSDIVVEYENTEVRHLLKNLTELTYAERIKMLQSSIAAKIVKRYKGNIVYPSPAFHTYLETKKISPVKKTRFFTLEQQDLAQENLSTEQRVNILEQLIDQLHLLNIELIDYDRSKIPSVRLSEFISIVQSLNIDYCNPSEAKLVDDLIDKAQLMKLPCFEQVYYAFTNRWKGFNVKKNFENILIFLKNPDQNKYFRDHYYLILDENNSWNLFYIDVNKVKHEIPISEIDGLEALLQETTEKPDKFKVYYLLKQYIGLRPLGFFKLIQQTITAFVNSNTFEEALTTANELDRLQKEYIEHLEDITRRPTEKFIGWRQFKTYLGVKIQWTGFDLSNNDAPSPYIRFLPWAKQDLTGVIALTLFRMGLSNLDDLILAMTQEQLFYLSKLSCQECVFWGHMKGHHDKYVRYTSFKDFPRWAIEHKSIRHITDDAMFRDPNLTFEEAFIEFFDNNLPGLILPNFSFNANHDAQKRLLNEFYRVAIEGSIDDQNVVSSFFYGREDKRDLKNLLTQEELTESAFSREIFKHPQGYNLELDSNYAQFICLQTLGEKQHHLFDNYDIEKLLALNYFVIIDHTKETDFEPYRILWRLPDNLSLEELFLALIDKCEKYTLKRDAFPKDSWDFMFFVQQLGFMKDRLVKLYFKHVKEHIIFSEPINRILAIQEGYLLNIQRSLNAAQWPNLQHTELAHMNIDELIQQYIVFDSHTIFPSHEIKSQFGQIILHRILRLPSDEQIHFYEQWFGSKKLIPLSDVTLKNTLMDNWVFNYTLKLGKDDNSQVYYDRVTLLFNTIKEKISPRDLQTLMNKLLNAIEAQGKLSDYIGRRIAPNEYVTLKSNMNEGTIKSLAILIKVANFFNADENHKEAFLDFISSPLSETSVASMADYIETHMDVKEMANILGWYTYEQERENNSKALIDSKMAIMLISLYHQFWDRSITERAVIIEKLLIPANMTISSKLQQSAYDRALESISAKLFPEACDKTTHDYLSLCILKAYLNTAEEYQRPYLLAAMLVATQQSPGQEMSVAKKFSLLCEHLGPAYVKLAQAIHSYPDTSDDIRADLVHVKGKANPPTRWALWRLLTGVVTEEDLAKIKRVGRLLGSASYNLALEVTLEDDSTVVLLLLREGAAKSAAEGFKHIQATINACEHDFILDQREMLEHTIQEAARLSENEMDKEASIKQSHLASSLYPNRLRFQLANRPIEIEVKTAKIISSEDGYRFIDFIEGEEFNNLPDTTMQERFIKRAIAKAIVIMELGNILNGGSFDSDRHGNQVRVKITENNWALKLEMGLYDFGEMALEPPTEEELHQLEEIISKVAYNLINDNNMDKLIVDRINKATICNESTHYLMRLRKAFLAMSDFYHYLDKEDITDIVQTAFSNTNIHPILYEQFLHEPLNYLAMMIIVKSTWNWASSHVSKVLNKVGLFGNYHAGLDDDNKQNHGVNHENRANEY